LPRIRILALSFLQAVTLGLGALKADDLRLHALNGPERSLQEYMGQAVVLNFWATWCEPCRDEMPLFVSAHKRYSARGLVIIGASADEESTRAHIPAFLRKMRIEFPIWTGRR
jgi:thiol-disulfide isomerase/thioredoxin